MAVTALASRRFIADLQPAASETSMSAHTLVRGWIYRLRVLAKSTFIVVRDCSGELQCVAATEDVKALHLKLEDCVELVGECVPEARATGGRELRVRSARVLNPAGHALPFQSSTDLEEVGMEALLEYRPLAARNAHVGDVFRLQAEILQYARTFLREQRFTEIITSKLVASGTEGGTHLFPIEYFERSAYLAQSPQFYKEHGVAAFERVFEFGHVYRAEPHASSRHLTEYYSLDFEFGFIDGPEDVIEMERQLLHYVFERIASEHVSLLSRYRQAPLPDLRRAPVWSFEHCLSLLAEVHARSDLRDDLDPLAERQLCAIAQQQCGVAAVFVLGFPLSSRPFYSAPRGDSGAAQSFDLLLEGVEITSGGQRLHRRADLEAALLARNMDPAGFAAHLRMFDLGMPPHGGFAIGLERLTAQVLGLRNVREAVLYPRDRYRLTP